MSDHETLPTHPSTGLTALAVLPSGRVVWPVLGGSEENATEEEPPEEGAEGPGEDPEGEEEEGDAEGDKPLGPAGEKALKAEKERRRAEAKRRRELEAELARLKGGGEQGDPDAIRREAAEAATAKANARIVRAEVRAAAAGKLADPKDALKFLDLDQFEVDEDGEIDTDEIADAITDLITNKPYLAAQSGKRFQGTGDGGSRNGGRPKQITSREELAKLSPAQRLKAHQEGRLKNLLQN